MVYSIKENKTIRNVEMRPVSTWKVVSLFGLYLTIAFSVLPGNASALTVLEVAKDLACPCQCPLILEDCNMTCGLEWKNEIGRLIKTGMNKQEIMNHFIAQYGEEARLTPRQKIDGKIYQYTGISTRLIGYCCGQE